MSRSKSFSAYTQYSILYESAAVFSAETKVPLFLAFQTIWIIYNTNGEYVAFTTFLCGGWNFITLGRVDQEPMSDARQ
jgi:hypothetical protein